MRFFFAVTSTATAADAFATTVTPSPQAVPALDGWGLAAIGVTVALAGAIAVFRIRK